MPAGDLYFRQKLMPRLRFLEQAQWWDREKLYQERERRLRRLVRVAAAEVPFYRDLFERARVNSDEIRSPEDLRRLPVLTKAMLRASPHRTTRDTGLPLYRKSSSGSTGAPFTLLEDADTAGFYRASFMLALEWAGWRVGEPHLQIGMTLKRSADRRLKDALLGCHYASGFDLRDPHLDAILDTIERKNIRHLWGYPGSLYFLARRARKLGWNRPMRTAVTWGDMLYPHYRRAIEGAFGVRVNDTYGCAEGIQVAAQCGHDGSYHIHTTDAIVEILDDAGDPVAPGQAGNAILTRLHAGPTPLIRYQVGDLVVRGPEEFCACGRRLDRLEGIQGRDADVVLTPSGNRLIVHFFTGILEFFPEIECFQVRQTELSAVTLSIVPVEGAADTSELIRRVVRALHEKGASDLRIDVQIVPEIPTAPSGKRRFVVSQVRTDRMGAVA